MNWLGFSIRAKTCQRNKGSGILNTHKGKLIVIEGLDGSGKATQSELLYQSLLEVGDPVRKISFPDYGQPSSTLVKMYLSGEIGSLEEVNAYAASSFYAVDRYVSYQTQWKDDYLGGKLIIADRYTTSNAAHQMVKLPKEQWDGFLSWLEEYEYNLLGIPWPDGVIYLDMEPETSRRLIEGRYQGDESKKDIHEANFQYLLRCREAALYAAQRLGWRTVRCCDGISPLPIEKIAESVRRMSAEILK